jgi:hypothetical protein
VDIELILHSAEMVTLALKDATRRILTATAKDMGVALELAGVLCHQAEGRPEVHITAAADELLTHLLATGEDVLALEDGVFMTRAGIGAQAVMTRAELGGVDDPNPAQGRRATAATAARVTPPWLCGTGQPSGGQRFIRSPRAASSSIPAASASTPASPRRVPRRRPTWLRDRRPGGAGPG